MNKSELLSNYTAEQIAERYLNLLDRYNKREECYKKIINTLPEELKQGTEFHLEIDRLQSEVEKYQKAFEDAKKERDCQIAEYQKKIDELDGEAKLYKEAFEKSKRVKEQESSELHKKIYHLEQRTIADFLPAEPIKVADMLISATYTRKKGDMKKAIHKAFGNNADAVTENVYSISELRQIAEHLLVYCNANGESENEINR